MGRRGMGGLTSELDPSGCPWGGGGGGGGGREELTYIAS